MKRSFLITFLLIILFSCSNSENTMELSGNIKGLKKGMIYLQKLKDSSLINLDSALIDGVSLFNFKEVIDEPEVLYLYLKLKDGSLKDIRLPFFAEASEMNINTDLKNFVLGARITGSVNQNKVNEHQKIIDRFSDKNLELIEQHFKATQRSDDSLISEIETKQRNLISSKYLATVNFSIRNKHLEVAPYLMLNVVPNINEKYLDTVYQSLNPEIKDSKYGKTLGNLIKTRKTEN